MTPPLPPPPSDPDRRLVVGLTGFDGDFTDEDRVLLEEIVRYPAAEIVQAFREATARRLTLVLGYVRILLQLGSAPTDQGTAQETPR